MPADAPVTISAGALSAADLATIRNLLRWTEGFTAGSKPFAKVRSSVDVALPTDGWNDMTWNTVVFNRGESLLFDGGAPTLFTAPQTGFYLCGACVRTAPTTANKALRILLNSTSEVEHDNIGVSTPAFTQISITTLLHLTATDTLTAQVFQDSGASINAVVDGNTPNFWCAWYAIDDD